VLRAARAEPAAGVGAEAFEGGGAGCSAREHAISTEARTFQAENPRIGERIIGAARKKRGGHEIVT
jgi:hypothetical protein